MSNWTAGWPDASARRATFICCICWQHIVAAPAAAEGAPMPTAAPETAPPRVIELAAQPLPEDDAHPPPLALENIIVRASLREADQRDVAASIFAINGEELEARGAGSLQDVLPLVPGVGQMEFLSDLNRIAIRGIQTDATTTTPQTTGVFINDVPLNDPFLAHQRPDLYPFDLKRIEILKGPQGTVIGGSALAGALRYELVGAQPGEWSARGFAHYQSIADSSARRTVGAALNLPLGGDAALRLVGVEQRFGGMIDDLRSGEADTDDLAMSSTRALFRWELSNGIGLGLTALRQETQAEDMPVAETTDGRLERQRALVKSPSKSRFDIYSLDIEYAFSWADFVSTTSLLNKLSDLSNATGARTLGTEDLGQPVRMPVTADIDGLVQEFRLISPASPSSRWSWLAGLFTHHYAGISTQRAYAEPAESGLEVEILNFLADIKAREHAIFGEASFALLPELEATVGLRGYIIETGGSVVSNGALLLVSGSPESRSDADIRESGVNPRLALQYRINEAASIYTNVARGFRFGGIQLVGSSPASPNVPETYSPDSVWSYELGLRTQWLDNRLQLDGVAFYLDWKDPQVRTTTEGAVAFNIVDNVGAARSHGAEFGLRYRPPLPGLEFSLAGSYVDARTTAPYTTAGGSGSETVEPGSRLPGHARHQLVTAVDYRRNIERWQFHGQILHARHGPGVSDILQSMKILDYHTTDLRLSMAPATGASGLQLILQISNLTDERAVTSAFVVDADNFTTLYNRPRTLAVRLAMAI